MEVAHHFLVLAGPARWAPWPAWGRRRATRLLRGAHPGVKGLARDSESTSDDLNGIETLASLPRPFRRPNSVNRPLTMALLALGLPGYSGRGGSTGHPPKCKAFSATLHLLKGHFPSENGHSGNPPGACCTLALMTDSATIMNLPGGRPAALGAEPPKTVEALAEKLATLRSYSARYGIACTAAELLDEILADVQHVQAVSEAEWIPAAQAAQISGYSSERLRQMAANGRLTRNGSRYRRGEIQRLKHRIRPVRPTATTPVEAPPVETPDAVGGGEATATTVITPTLPQHVQSDPQSNRDHGVRNPLTGRALGIHTDRLRQ